MPRLRLPHRGAPRDAQIGGNHVGNVQATLEPRREHPDTPGGLNHQTEGNGGELQPVGF